MDVIEKRMRPLLSQYRSKRGKAADAKNSGSGADDIKVPKWFAYQRFTFLVGIHKPKKKNRK
jgi:hypothetical protein